MEERKSIGIISTLLYKQEIGKIIYYLNSKEYITKHPLLAYGGLNNRRIIIVSISLEDMDYLHGHKGDIYCLSALSPIILASGSEDTTIKLWNLGNKALITTLSQHAEAVNALCHVNAQVLVSGSLLGLLIVWHSAHTQYIYIYIYRLYRHVLTGHASEIVGIIRINNREIISGEFVGDLRIWDITEGVCIKHIPSVTTSFQSIWDMKKLYSNNSRMAVCMTHYVYIWADNNWNPLGNLVDLMIAHLQLNSC